MASQCEMNCSTQAHLFPRVQIGDALVDACLFDEMTQAIVQTAALAQEPKYVVTPNVQHIVLLASDNYLRKVYSEADFVLPDGVSLLLAASALGQRIPERIAGVDMFQALCREAARNGLRVFFLGGRSGSAEKAASKLRAEYEGLIVSGICCPPLGFENDPSQENGIEACIRAARPHFLFVALGAPKQEYWIYEHARKLGVPVSIGVGGSFEMVGGVIARAPLCLRNVGLEWLYRLAREPRRLWRRYLFSIIEFVQIVLRQRRGVKIAALTSYGNRGR